MTELNFQFMTVNLRSAVTKGRLELEHPILFLFTYPENSSIMMESLLLLRATFSPFHREEEDAKSEVDGLNQVQIFLNLQ